MELLQIKAFVSLAQTSHMAQTAQAMGTSASYVSRLIGSLEAELGTKLFDRLGRGVALNERGQLFYSYVHEIVPAINNGQIALKRTGKSLLGTVRIGNYAFAPALYPCMRAFLEKNPYVSFRLRQIGQMDPGALLSGTDFVLTSMMGDTYLMQTYFPVYRVLLEEEFFLVVSPRLVCFPEGKKSLKLEEMKEYPIVEAEPFPFYQNWIYQDWIYQEKEVDSLTDQRGFRFRIGAVSNDYYTKLSMIEQGFGFGIFPKICIESALRFAPDLRVFAIEDHPAHRKLLVARKETMQMTAAARSFWEFLIEYHHLPADE